jgi:hypothetical protein
MILKTARKIGISHVPNLAIVAPMVGSHEIVKGKIDTVTKCGALIQIRVWVMTEPISLASHAQMPFQQETHSPSFHITFFVKITSRPVDFYHKKK